MTYAGTTYVVDTNTLSQLGSRRRSSRIFQNVARIPSEVLHEAEGFPDAQTLQRLEVKTTPSILLRLKEVMASIPTDDITLVDLYANRGGADPLMIACALDGREQEAQTLDPRQWIIVTGDHAVGAHATVFGIRVLDNAGFAELIDEASR